MTEKGANLVPEGGFYGQEILHLKQSRGKEFRTLKRARNMRAL